MEKYFVGVSKTRDAWLTSYKNPVLRSASLLFYFNVYSSMADKQLKRRLYFLCY